MPGGITDTEKTVDSKLKQTLAPINTELLTKVDAIESESDNTEGYQQPTEVVPVSYKSQVVAGVNYFVKYLIRPSGKYYHARIFRALGKNPEIKLVRIVGPKSENDPITYF